MQKSNDPTQHRTPGKRYLDFFVDEAGDDTLFDKKGRVIVGQEGCSKNAVWIIGLTRPIKQQSHSKEWLVGYRI